MDGARDGEVLNAAIIAGDLEKVRALLDAGISVTQPDHFRQLPMFVAARDGKEAIISLLLDRGVDVNAPVLDGRTPLYYAAAHGRPEAVRVLLSRGATVDVLDSYGQTPLLAATTSLSNESLNVPDLKAWRARQQRQPQSFAQVVEYLLLAGADAKLSRKGAYPPSYFIRAAGVPRLVDLVNDQSDRETKRSLWASLFGCA